MRIQTSCPHCLRSFSIKQHVLLYCGDNRFYCNYCNSKLEVTFPDKRYYWLIYALLVFNSMFATICLLNSNYPIGFGFVILFLVSGWIFENSVTLLVEVENFTNKEKKVFRDLALLILIIAFLIAGTIAKNKWLNEPPVILIART